MDQFEGFIIISWYLKDPLKLIDDIENMENDFPEFTLLFDSKTGTLKWKGNITIESKDYLVEIHYPASYPFFQPKIFVYQLKDGEYQRETFNDSVHSLGDGSICLFTWDDGEYGWKQHYSVDESIYKLYNFISLFNKDQVPQEHYSIGPTDFLKINRGIIFPLKRLKGIKDFDHGIMGLTSFSSINKLTLVVNGLRIKSKSNKDRIISFKSDIPFIPVFPLIPRFISMKWFHIPEDLFLQLNQRKEISEFNKILVNIYPNWEDEDFLQPIMFLTTKESQGNSIELQNPALCVVKHPTEKLLLGRIQVSFGKWDELYFTRIRELIGNGFEIFENNLICLIGVGSLGGEIAAHLVKTGFKHFLLIDPDVLVLENLPRHVLDMPYLHEYKVVGLKHLLTRRNPKVNINYLINSILEPRIPFYILEYAENLKKSLIMVNTTANLDIDYLINSFCLSYRVPAIFAYCNSKVQMGRILRIIPYTTPCFHCFTEKSKENAVLTFPQDEEIAIKAPYQLGLPGVGLDISEIAVSTARMILQTILECNDSNALYPKNKWNNLLKVIHPVNGLNPGLHPVEIVRNPQCIYCGNIESKIEDIDNVKSLLTRLMKESQDEKNS